MMTDAICRSPQLLAFELERDGRDDLNPGCCTSYLHDYQECLFGMPGGTTKYTQEL